MKKNKLQHNTIEGVLLARLTHLTNDAGEVVYPGDGDAAGRTGSQLTSLLEYVFNNVGDKLLDTDLFRSFLHSDMKVPLHLLNLKPKKWNKLNWKKTMFGYSTEITDMAENTQDIQTPCT